MDSETRAALVEELTDAMYGTITFDGGYAVSRGEVVKGAERCLPIIDRLLADRATTAAEPDADTVERVATAIRASWQDIAAAWQEHRGHNPLWDELDGMDALQMAEAALAAMPSAPANDAVERVIRLEAQLRYLRGYTIATKSDLMSAMNGGNVPTDSQIKTMIEVIDSNIAHAGDRAVLDAVAKARKEAGK